MRELYITFTATKHFEESSYYLKRVVREAVKETLDYENFPYDAGVSVTFCDNEYIRGLNNEFRGIDRHTDVLSFPMYEDGDFDEVECAGGAVLGDIVISIERAKEQAKEIGNTFHHEIAFLTVHSVLHLLGYDHERSPEDDDEQCRRQKAIIENVDI
jgi:probable rRNA maturation factor